MWYPSVVVEPPTAEVLSIEQVKRQSRIDGDDEDALIGDLIEEVTDHTERYCGLRLPVQTLEMRCDAFADMAVLPDGPVQSITSIEYIAPDGIETALATDVYELRAEGLVPSIVLRYGKAWPSIQPGSRIVVTAVAGFDELPPAIRNAMRLWVAKSFEQRENAPDDKWSAFDSPLSNFRRFG
jgi:uncharacterized phiE125 gp8 family phage protein